MLKPYELLEGVLNEIEKGLREEINTEALAGHFSLSKSHLRRLFEFAFGQSLGTYIRSRKMAASIEDLLQTDLNILDIAVDYGFGYEQSYIRTFKHEFGCTPGELRKNRQIVKIKPPLQLFDSNRLGDYASFGPDIVMVPSLHLAGIKHNVPFGEETTLPPVYLKRFYDNERTKVKNVVNPHVLFSVATEARPGADYCYFMPAVQVESFKNIPEMFESYTFPSSLCARFRLIGPDDGDLNKIVAKDMFNAVDAFMNDNRQKYCLERKISLDRFDQSAYNGMFKLWEWFSPVVKKVH